MAIDITNIKNNATATLSPAAPYVDWTVDDASKADYSLSIATGELKDMDIKNILSTSTPKQTIVSPTGYFMPLPQTIDDDAEISITIGYGSAPVKTSTITKKLKDITPTLEIGKKYTLNIVTTVVDQITITATVSSWTNRDITVPSFN